MTTSHQATQFIVDSEQAIDHLFAAIEKYHVAVEAAQVTVEEIELSKDYLLEFFKSRDQFSPNANHYYSELMKRIESLDKKITDITGKDDKTRLDDSLKSIGATDESMSTLAGTILQIAKQTISLRHNEKPNINARQIGTQNIVDVIWEGRNHSVHWEEGEPRPNVRNMFDSLYKDFGTQFVAGRNNSLSILGVLDWKSTSNVTNDLKKLV